MTIWMTANTGRGQVNDMTICYFTASGNCLYVARRIVGEKIADAFSTGMQLKKKMDGER